jgi:hypothetical protein
MMAPMEPEEQPTATTVEVEPGDREWITPEVAALVLQRASDGSTPIPWEDVKADLDEMRRLGI